LTRDGYRKMEVKMRIAINKEVFNRKIPLLKNTILNSGRDWLGVMFGALLYLSQRPGH
jgi:hypothetical protein